MKYIIYKRTHRIHKLNQETKLYELIETPRYYILRKGKIFGFMHDVGDWLCDSQGNSFCAHDEFDSVEQAISYLNCWHVETYGDREPILVSLDISVHIDSMLND